MVAAKVEPLDWNEAPEMLTVEECRRLLRAGDRQVRAMLKEENLEVRVRGSIRVPKVALKAWVQEQTRK